MAQRAGSSQATEIDYRLQGVTGGGAGTLRTGWRSPSMQPKDDAMAPKRTRAPHDVPDSLPKDQNRTDVLPDQGRAAVEPQVPPASAAPSAEETAPDGGSDQHPIHDDDLEDRDSQDYERDIDQIDSDVALDVALRRQD
ncbi:MAG TPA: hypothetical protein VGN55_03195 [Xanthobacteraceae bacterium]